MRPTTVASRVRPHAARCVSDYGSAYDRVGLLPGQAHAPSDEVRRR